MSKRMVALSIGISEARPLEYLAAAVNGARRFHEWALASSYDATLLVDEEGPVTMPRLRGELERILGNPQPIERFILYFAGHGLIREAEEGLWLLSDWRKELRAVAFEVLKRRLRKWGVQQISIFSDSCRSLPADVDQIDLAADPVLGEGPLSSAVMPPVDKFVAAQDGTETFAVPGNDPSEDRCIFSGVLMEGLWGLKTGAFSKRVPNLVTSNSLGTYLRSEVPLRAEAYRWRVVPNPWPGFPEGEDIYFGEQPRPKAPTFPEWPDPSRFAATRTVPSPPDSHVLRGPFEAAPAAPAPAAPAPAPAARLEKAIRAQNVPSSFETGTGFALTGARVLAVWANPEVVVGRGNAEGWWHVGVAAGNVVAPPAWPAPIIIECDNGTFVATVALPRFIASILCDANGASAVVYRGVFTTSREVDITARALAELERGSLRADAKTDLAVELRRGKHADPVLGCVSAYLYDSAGDLDSIRRMAWAYVEHGQPIPYDIALLGQLEGQWQGGMLVVKVPAIAAREPRTLAERNAPWSYAATKQVLGEVGGLWPWLRQGWVFLDDPLDVELTLIQQGLIEVIPRLRRSRFTTFDAQGGHRLAQLFGLTRRTE